VTQDIADFTTNSTIPMWLAFATGGRSDTRLVVKEYDWDKLCALTTKPKVGEKDGSYLIRGGKLKSPKRADDNLIEGELIILDGDSRFDPETGEVIEGAPPLPEVAKALDALGITFCAHTSHSARPEDGFWKYRILIPAKLRNQQELADCVDFILEQLRGFGIYLTDVPEAKRWSQPWYLPRVRDERAKEHFVSLRADCLPFDVRMAAEWAQARRQAEAAIEAQRRQEAAQQQPEGRAQPYEGESKITSYNDAQSQQDVRAVLERAGYQFIYYDRAQDALRFMRPGSTTKTAGVVLFKGKLGHWCVYSHHGAADPLSGKVSDPFALVAELQHGGDKKAAFRAIFPREKEPSIAERISARQLEGRQVIDQPAEDQDEGEEPAAGEAFIPKPELKAADKKQRVIEIIPSWELKDVAVRWLIKDIVPAESFMALYGRPGSYKSFIALYLSYCIAAGVPAFDKPATKGAVVYIAGEGGAGLRRRWEALRQHHGVTDQIGVYFIKAQLNLRSTLEDADAAIAAIRSLNIEPALIVVDTFARAFAGGEENSAKDVGEAVAVMGYMQEQLRAGVLIVHHAGKDESRGMRGSSALLGAVDLELECVKISQEGSTERVGQLTITKQKDGEDGIVLGYRMEAISLSQIDPEASSLAVEPIATAALQAQKAASKTDKGDKARGHTKEALEALRTATAEAGEIPGAAGVHIPSGVRCVRESLWREYFRQVMTCDLGSQERNAWKRAKTYLADSGAAGHWGDWWWIVGQAKSPAPGIGQASARDEF
jgi:AAA domain